MGNLLLLLTRPGDDQVSFSTHPTQADWITKHSLQTGLSFVEVERLWMRFKQLGCNADGVLTEEVISNKQGPIYRDKFMHNILKKLRVNTGNGNNVTFQTFLNSMYWMDDQASLEDKVKASFGLLNNGRPVNEKLLMQLLATIFPNKTHQEYERLQQAMLEQMGTPAPDGTGYEVTEESFLNFTMTNFARSHLQSIFAFQIVPENVKLNQDGNSIFGLSQQTFTRPSNASSRQGDEYLSADQLPTPRRKDDALMIEASYLIPTDKQLAMVADTVQARDFHVLGNKLGFFESDMAHLENMFPGDRRQIFLSILREWRKREGDKAYIVTLQKALHESRMKDAADMLKPQPTTGPGAKKNPKTTKSKGNSQS